MKILIAGVGALGSNIARSLIPDTRNHTVGILDFDNLEKRNIEAGTQWYFKNQIGLPKVEALQFNIYQAFEKQVNLSNYKVTEKNVTDLRGFDLVIDCFDNHEARRVIQKLALEDVQVLHAGFSTDFTYAIEWGDNYTAPGDIDSSFDICEEAGAASFINHVASLTSLIAIEYINNNKKIEMVGGKMSQTIME